MLGRRQLCEALAAQSAFPKTLSVNPHLPTDWMMLLHLGRVAWWLTAHTLQLDK